MSDDIRGRVNHVCIAVEAYFPDESGTPFLMTQIARAMARAGVRVTVVTSTPGESSDGAGIQVWRAGTARQTTRRFVVRGFRMLHSALLLARQVRRTAPSCDAVYLVQGPTLLPTFALLALSGLSQRHRVVVVVHDLYPDSAIAAGAIRERSIVARLWRVATQIAFARADRIISLGNDMSRRIASAYPGTEAKLRTIPHWSVSDAVRRIVRHESAELVSAGLQSNFVVQYAGNVGLTHGIAAILDGERRIRDSELSKWIRFVFFGSGAAADLLQAAAAEHGSLVRFLGTRLRTAQTDFLGCCDVAVIGYAPGMVGVSVPSRTPSVLASGRPIIAIADAESDLSRLVVEEGLGWVVPPGDGAEFASAVRNAYLSSGHLEEMGQRAARIASRLDSVDTAARRYLEVAVEG